MNKFVSELSYNTVYDVWNEYPNAVEVVEVDGGWMIFYSIDDFNTWQNQK